MAGSSSTTGRSFFFLVGGFFLAVGTS